MKKRAQGRSAMAVHLSVTACNPLDRIRVRDVGESVGGGQLRGACPGSPPPFIPQGDRGPPANERLGLPNQERINLHGRWAM